MPHLSTAERIGRRIGREEGRDQGRREMLLDQMAAKFGPISETVTTAVRAPDTEQVQRLGRRVLTAETMADLGLPFDTQATG